MDHGAARVLNTGSPANKIIKKMTLRLLIGGAYTRLARCVGTSESLRHVLNDSIKNSGKRSKTGQKKLQYIYY